ncbi:MAG: pyridoxamine 5-phosphate oxidase-related FMN-binding [Candidatus Binatus sp.]|nr:pyridoxamine 5-phosphate oxidase-related FMN-binding [Candidatus Binatus sp.]
MESDEVVLRGNFRGLSDRGSSDLSGERYLSLATFRCSGVAVPTPLWIAAVDGKLYAVTDGTSAKMKRLKANDRIRIAPCDAQGKVQGEWIDGHASRVEDSSLEERARASLARKYGWQFWLLSFFSRLFGRIERRAYIEIRI